MPSVRRIVRAVPPISARIMAIMEMTRLVPMAGRSWGKAPPRAETLKSIVVSFGVIVG